MRIIFYCGPTPAEWTPDSLDKGLGGSETMVVQMAKHLAKENEVIVYNDSEGGVWDDVKYINYDDLEKDDCDILIVWRNPQMIIKLPITAKKKYLWLHDCLEEPELLPYIYLFDKIIVLSEFHRMIYPRVPDERLWVTRNAMEKLEVSEIREPYRMIYASNYDRGLKVILENWTEIKLNYPKAELYVAYGWETLENIARVNKTMDSFKIFKDYIENLLNQEGIHHLGKISKLELAKEFSKANYWVYPCIYPEVSCITGMEAQTYGAVPVVFASGAVPETVTFGKILGKTGQVKEEEFIKALFELFDDQVRTERIRKIMRVDFGFEELVKEWQKEFQL